LLATVRIEDVANEVGVSSFYLQKGFKFMTGYSMAEYIRNRKLYLSALDVISDKKKVIDIAYEYGYDTPESFTKAFSRFHGMSPMQLKREPYGMNVFLPLKIQIKIQGGNDMDYVVEKMKSFKVIGFEREFSFESGYQEIPKFWNTFCDKYMKSLCGKKEPNGEIEKIVRTCCVGEYGVCIDDIGKDGKFRYLIAGKYTEGNVPEKMTVYEFPDMEWAKFSCKGPMPGALQAVNTKLFKEWLPGNPDYEIAMGANIEWYGEGDLQSIDYQSAIWIPVKRK
jgi:predicted transcriptional regulator YdeE/AraC-like DNA-binding protein